MPEVFLPLSAPNSDFPFFLVVLSLFGEFPSGGDFCMLMITIGLGAQLEMIFFLEVYVTGIGWWRGGDAVW